jgi:hypothetical protein
MNAVITSIIIENMKLIHPERKAPIAAPKTATTRYKPISHQRFINPIVTDLKLRLAVTGTAAIKFMLVVLVVIPHIGHGPVCSDSRGCPLLQRTSRPSDIGVLRIVPSGGLSYILCRSFAAPMWRLCAWFRQRPIGCRASMSDNR